MKKKEIKRQKTKCQVCGNTNLTTVISLGHQAITQQYLTDTLTSETLYPLNFCRCDKCGLVQLDHIVDPEIVFPKNYPYRTGLTNMLLRNFEKLAESCFENALIKECDLIVDIGSNDGSLLRSFQKRGARVCGIEPTDSAKEADRSGIPTVQDFINSGSAKKVIKRFGKAKIVTATNAFAHIENVHRLVGNIKKLMSKDAVFISESQYLMDIVQKLEFDTIYHEHLRFYSLKPLAKLFSSIGMSLVDAERISAAGGSIRVYAARKGKYKVRNTVAALLEEEKPIVLDKKNLLK